MESLVTYSYKISKRGAIAFIRVPEHRGVTVVSLSETTNDTGQNPAFIYLSPMIAHLETDNTSLSRAISLYTHPILQSNKQYY